MMFKGALVVAVSVLLLNHPGAADEIDGVNVPGSIPSGKVKLLLNGAGYRRYDRMVRVYIGSLYLMKKSSDSRSIIETDEPMAIRLQITSDMITDKKMADATRESFTHTTEVKFTAIEERVAKFISVFDEAIKKNDVYELVYEPGKGVSASKNGALKVTIPGLDFKKALFGIWLSDEPVDAKLKVEMLGR
ncbi:MAG: chalcone isomerase family protein [Candidatus Tritonobacter lacicola]|nr:chalcone isomerase family protein [Candidatus Tritonobacter lacicola]